MRTSVSRQRRQRAFTMDVDAADAADALIDDQQPAVVALGDVGQHRRVQHVAFDVPRRGVAGRVRLHACMLAS
jgi:hypothetical protein